MDCYTQEIFGPVLSLLEVGTHVKGHTHTAFFSACVFYRVKRQNHYRITGFADRHAFLGGLIGSLWCLFACLLALQLVSNVCVVAPTCSHATMAYIEQSCAASLVASRVSRKRGMLGRAATTVYDGTVLHAATGVCTPLCTPLCACHSLQAADLDEAIRLVNANPYGNGTAIFTDSGSAARRFQHDVQVRPPAVHMLCWDRLAQMQTSCLAVYECIEWSAPSQPVAAQCAALCHWCLRFSSWSSHCL